MRKAIFFSIPFFLITLAAIGQPNKVLAQAGCQNPNGLIPPNTIPQAGSPITFGVILDNPPTPGQQLTIGWGTWSANCGSGSTIIGTNCFIPTDSSSEVTINPGLNDGTYCAWIFGGCTASPDLNNAQCGRSFQVGSSSGGTPWTPPDERSTFMCRGNPSCEQCILSGNWWTVFGCIPTGQGGFVQTIVNLVTGVAGGIAFLIMLKGAALLMTSQGDPNQIQAGKSSMTKGAAGLLIVVFATVILRIIAADILKLPGFGQ